MTTTLWIRLTGLPLEFYDAEALSLIGNKIGKLIKIYATTANTEKGRFARLCVEVDLTDPIPTAIELDSYIQLILVENSSFCFGCGTLGHDQACCTKLPLLQTATLAKSSKPGPWSHIPTKSRKIAPGNKRHPPSNGTLLTNSNRRSKPNTPGQPSQNTFNAALLSNPKVRTLWKKKPLLSNKRDPNPFSPLKQVIDPDAFSPTPNKSNTIHDPLSLHTFPSTEPLASTISQTSRPENTIHQNGKSTNGFSVIKSTISHNPSPTTPSKPTQTRNRSTSESPHLPNYSKLPLSFFR